MGKYRYNERTGEFEIDRRAASAEWIRRLLWRGIIIGLIILFFKAGVKKGNDENTSEKTVVQEYKVHYTGEEW